METQQTLNSSTPNLQGSGGVQPGAGNLQQQNSSTPYQQTSGLQQDALGPESYRSFDALTVQGQKQTVPAVAVGKGSSDVFIGVFIVLVICAVFVFRHYKKTYPLSVTAESVLPQEDIQPEVTHAVHSKPVKKKKSSSVKVKPKKKSAAKAKRRKK